MRKLTSLIRTVVVTTVVMTATSCNKVPDYVIKPDDMASLLADIHIGESFVESNYAKYQSDSARMLVKQSVVFDHGYTMEQVDTSFMWYGGHLGLYEEIYDKTIQILEDRIRENNSSRSAALRSEMSGDSTDVWTGARRYELRPTMPSQFIRFDIPVEANRPKGDMYTLRASYTNLSTMTKWNIQGAYEDGTIEFVQVRFSGGGKHEMTFYADSTKNLKRLYGSMYIDLDNENPLATTIMDSVSMVRKDLVPRLYPQRHRQQAIEYKGK